MQIEMNPVDSSQIAAIGYDPETEVLAVQFLSRGKPGSTYHYSGVPSSVWLDFQAADSFGNFFGKNIKGFFPFERQPDEPGGVGFGLSLAQSSKYTVNKDGRLCSRSTGIAIPDDEPVFILRAKDVHALAALRAYRLHTTASQALLMTGAVLRFEEFEADHPDRMKEPDTTPVVR